MSHPNPHALAAATALAERLADPHTARAADSARRRPQSLAGGAAGIALLRTERARAGHGDWPTAHAWLSAAVREDLSAGPNASLFFTSSISPDARPPTGAGDAISHWTDTVARGFALG